jgi:hypothetical protein
MSSKGVPKRSTPTPNRDWIKEVITIVINTSRAISGNLQSPAWRFEILLIVNKLGLVGFTGVVLRKG